MDGGPSLGTVKLRKGSLTALNLTVDDCWRHVLHDEEDLAGPGAGGGQEPVHDVGAEVHAQTHAENDHIMVKTESKASEAATAVLRET